MSQLQDERGSLVYRTRSRTPPKPSSSLSSVQVNPSRSNHQTSWNPSSYDSLSSLRPHVPVPSIGARSPGTSQPFPTSSNNSIAQGTVQIGSSPSLHRGLEELMSGIGSHLEEDLVSLLALSSPEITSPINDILHWRFDMQARGLPIAVRDGRRHTDPAAYPVQHAAGVYPYEQNL